MVKTGAAAAVWPLYDVAHTHAFGRKQNNKEGATTGKGIEGGE